MKNNGFIALVVVLGFFVGRFSIIAGFGMKKGWIEVAMFFGLWLLTSAFLEAAEDQKGEKVKEKQKAQGTHAPA